MIIAHGGDIILEHYFAPFDEKFLHRQYSVSKSITSLAVGFAVGDGLFSLNDRIAEHFPEYATENYCRQTVRDMLIMATEKVDQNWFRAKSDDRLKTYFLNSRENTKGAGALFDYDSSGAFVLGALIERKTGKALTSYLREKLFDKIGVSKEAYFLTCPGGHSWSDSGFMCTARDLFKIARFVMRGGDGLIDKNYIKDATSAQIFNNDLGINDYDTHGYGYLIWRSYEGSYAFLGMGSQIVLCLPERELCLIVNSDNQGIPFATKLIVDSFFELIARPISEALPENAQAASELEEYKSALVLSAAHGDASSPIANKINGKEYILGANSMGIKRLSVTFDGGCGTLLYENAQGEKTLSFGMCKNVFTKFPEYGYSDLVGGVSAERNSYSCAASAAFVEPHKLFIKVQIIDKYFGRLNIILSFIGKTCAVRMVKTAENFLNEYSGFAEGAMK